MLKWHHRQVCLWFQHISSFLSGGCDRSGSGTKEWIWFLRTRHSILPNTERHFWSMWRMNTVPNIDMCRSINLKAYWAVIFSLQQRLQDPVNHPLMHMIHSAMMNNTWRLTISLKWHPDEAITLHAYCQLPGSIQIHCVAHQRTGGKLIQISMITTPTEGRVAVHFGSWT